LGVIFEPFEQADGSTTRMRGGTGLGLAISRQLTELMGGSIWAESTVDRGSDFHFTVALGLEGSKPTPLEESHHPELGDLRVLVVDDHLGSRESITEVMRRWGVEVSSAANGEAALREIRARVLEGRSIDLLLVDLHMPDMDGFSLARSVLEDPSIPQPKVMIMTSAGRPGDGARCTSLGVAGYLMKPVMPSELFEAVQVALSMVRPPETEPGLVTRHLLRERRASMRILVAEDDHVNQKVITRLLEKRGHRVELVPDGELAVERAEAGSFDLVLMDVRMPRMDGLEASRKIRSLEKGTGKRLPIVALTAHAMKEQREECLSAGMDGYLSKPLNPEALWDLLDHFCRDIPETSLGQGGDHDVEANGGESVAESIAPFDAGHSLDLVDGDPGLLADLMSTFVEDSQDQINRLRASMEEGDANAVANAAHRLKGSASNFKAMRVTELAAEVERLAMAADLSGAGDILTALISAVMELTEAMKGFVTEGRAWEPNH
jgi:CheY-like chemotaxis protein